MSGLLSDKRGETSAIIYGRDLVTREVARWKDGMPGSSIIGALKPSEVDLSFSGFSSARAVKALNFDSFPFPSFHAIKSRTSPPHYLNHWTQATLYYCTVLMDENPGSALLVE